MENLIKSIDEHLKSIGFDKNDDTYSRTLQIQQPGATININGQVMQQPGQVIPCQYICEYTGEGWVDNVQMAMIRFCIMKGEEVALDYVEGIYLDEIEYFKKLCNQYFK